jgi:hypothetical protein
MCSPSPVRLNSVSLDAFCQSIRISILFRRQTKPGSDVRSRYTGIPQSSEQKRTIRPGSTCGRLSRIGSASAARPALPRQPSRPTARRTATWSGGSCAPAAFGSWGSGSNGTENVVKANGSLGEWITRSGATQGNPLSHERDGCTNLLPLKLPRQYVFATHKAAERGAAVLVA